MCVPRVGKDDKQHAANHKSDLQDAEARVRDALKLWKKAQKAADGVALQRFEAKRDPEASDDVLVALDAAHDAVAAERAQCCENAKAAANRWRALKRAALPQPGQTTVVDGARAQEA